MINQISGDIRLQPILHRNMDILFLALNPPSQSNSNGHFFSGDNSFWEILFLSGLLEKRVTECSIADIQVFRNSSINYKQAIYGITDLVRLLETDSRKVKPSQEDVVRVLEIIKEYQPKVLCLMHNKVRKAFEQEKIISGALKYGKVGHYNDTLIFMVPFPKGTNLSKVLLIEYYRDLRMVLNQKREIIPRE